MRPRQKPLVGLNVEEKNQIMDIGTDIVNLARLGSDERVRLGVENRRERVENEARVVNGDLEGVGDGGGADALARRRLLDELPLKRD